jgi:DNA-binding NtrC family response regulator
VIDKNAQQACSPPAEPIPFEIGKPRRILVVDDEADIRDLNTHTLTHSGFHVDAAKNGADAWEALQVTNYALVVTDHSMPKLSGVDLIRKLHAARMAIPVILATGTWPAHEFDRQPWLQPTAALIKPYTGEQLLQTVKQVLSAVAVAREQIATMPTDPNRLQL